jgi:glycosyltransferase involved in cell wall biosynthesis
MARKILLISYHFPPSTEVGGLRVANFAKRLSRLGWDPYVLTVKERYLESVDPARAGGIAQAKVFRAGETLSLAQLYLALKGAVRWVFGNKGASTAIAGGGSSRSSANQAGSETLRMKLRRYALAFLGLPDMHRNWLVPAAIHAVRIIRREKIDCILTSCPPYTVHLVGLLCRWVTGVTWVADFRDPWMTAGAKSLYATCSASLWIERRLERAVLSNADLVVTNTAALCEAFRTASGAAPARRFAFIPNGYDREFLSQFRSTPKNPVFSVVYAGSLYFGRTPEPVFRAIRELLNEGRMDADNVRFRLVGHCRHVEGRPMDELIERYGLERVVETLDPVPYSQAIEMIGQSHLALLLAPDQPYQVPAKVYDYMGIGTRVLALARNGATAELIRDTKIGGVFDPADIEGIKSFMATAYMERGAPREPGSADRVKQFDLDSVTSRLAEELDGVCA